jgi:hypothetical protein
MRGRSRWNVFAWLRKADALPGSASDESLTGALFGHLDDAHQQPDFQLRT